MKAAKKSFILLIGLGQIALGLATTSLTACHKKIPQQEWVASVGDEKIWVSDLKDLLEREKDNYDPALWEDTEGFLALKKQLLQGLIEQKLLVTEAKKKGLTVSDKQMEEELARLQSGYSQDEFEEMLKKQGTTLSIWKQSQQEKLLVDELLENEIHAAKEHPNGDRERQRYRGEVNRLLPRGPDDLAKLDSHLPQVTQQRPTGLAEGNRPLGQRAVRLAWRWPNRCSSWRQESPSSGRS